MEPRSAERGNLSFSLPPLHRLKASMEPRSAERGNMGLCALILSQSPLQWSHAQPNVETGWRRSACGLRTTRFNGATLSRTWKRRRLRFKTSTLCSLQWSHAQPNVETSGYRQIIRPERVLQWSHAQPNVETTGIFSRVPKVFVGFNGATLSRTWKRDAIRAIVARDIRLQWSHAQPNVETRFSGFRRNFR